jgi:hypothetical protein
MPLLSGDRIRTENGRVEVQFGDGASLHVDVSSTIDLQSDDVLRLLQGRVRLTIPGPARPVGYRIDTPSGWVQIKEPGEYRVSVTRPGAQGEVELVVLRGAADLMNEDGQTTLRAGERAFARAGSAPSYAYVYNSAAWDAFDRWSDDRRRQSAGASAQYLPETVRSYAATFDRHGSWRQDSSYGYVWYPAAAPGWRPYYNGRWASYPSFGWTWIGSDAWAWPTHHYGRWGFSAGAWFWIPGRTWAPAHVSWAYAPGYVSWCPLGWDNRPVVQFVHVSYNRGRYDPWHAWTVVPHQRFGSGYVNRYGVRGGAIDVPTRSAFVVRQAPPEVRAYAVPRGSAPIYAAGTRRGPGVFSAAGVTGRDRGPSDARPGAATPRASAAEARSPRSSVPQAGAVEDAAAAFRSRRPATAGSGSEYTAAARAPRPETGVSRGIATPRQAPAPDRTFDPGAVPVHRGAVQRQPGPEPTGGDERRRLEVPGYQRAPSAPQAAPRNAAPSSPERPYASPSRQNTYPVAPSERGARVYPGTTSDSGARARPEPGPGPAEGYRAAPRQAPYPVAPPEHSGQVYRGSSAEGGARARPEPGPPGSYRAVPRQASPAAPPPAYRPYGGAERRSAPSGPPPSAPPPAREGAQPRSATPPSGEPAPRARPDGGGGGERSGAVRRPGGGR